MDEQTRNEVVHCYVVATHRILCGVTGPARSTKHVSAVTCTSCRELLVAARRRAAEEADEAVDAPHGR
jgi:hypothetical protein